MVGLSVALELKARGADVTVYERGTELGGGRDIRAAGMLGAAFEWAAEEDQRALAALARHAGMIWPDFAARIERLGGGRSNARRKARWSWRGRDAEVGVAGGAGGGVSGARVPR